MALIQNKEVSYVPVNRTIKKHHFGKVIVLMDKKEIITFYKLTINLLGIEKGEKKGELLFLAHLLNDNFGARIKRRLALINS